MKVRKDRGCQNAKKAQGKGGPCWKMGSGGTLSWEKNSGTKNKEGENGKSDQMGSWHRRKLKCAVKQPTLKSKEGS